MKHGNAVKDARPLGGYWLHVRFRDGFTGDVDLAPLFQRSIGPMTEPFREAAYFARVSVDMESEVVTWPNGFDICSDVLRYYCELGRVSSREEMNAHFNPEPESVLVLNDKPTQ